MALHTHGCRHAVRCRGGASSSSSSVDKRRGRTRALCSASERGGGTRSVVGIAAASAALVGLGMMQGVGTPMPVPRGQPQTHEVVAVAATEELTPAARLAERKKIMQERVQKAKTSKYSTVAESPGANPSEPAATAPESSNDTPEQDRIATPESSESAAPADATPKAPERGKYEEASPAEVAAERKRLLAEKLEKEREKTAIPGAAMAYDGEDEMSEAARRQRAEQLKRDMEAMQNNPGYAPKTFATKENGVAKRKVQQQKPTAAKAREGKRGGAPLVLVQLFMLGTPAALFFLPEEAKRAYMKHWNMLDRMLTNATAPK